MRRGEIWWASLPPPWGRRPVLLISRNSAYDVLTWITVAALTTRVRDTRSQVPLDPRRDGVWQPCVANFDEIIAIPKTSLREFMATLRDQKMAEVDRAISYALGLPG